MTTRDEHLPPIQDQLLNSDPSLLQLIGIAADILGVGEQVQKLLPSDRLRIQRRHRRAARLRNELREHMDEARSSLVIVRAVLARRVRNRAPAEYSVDVSVEDFPIYKKGLDWLHISVREMTNTAYELEAVSETVQSDAERYYRLSERGRTLIDSLKRALDGSPEATEALLEGIDRYLATSSSLLAEFEAEG